MLLPQVLLVLQLQVWSTRVNKFIKLWHLKLNQTLSLSVRMSWRPLSLTLKRNGSRNNLAKNNKKNLWENRILEMESSPLSVLFLTDGVCLQIPNPSRILSKPYMDSYQEWSECLTMTPCLLTATTTSLKPTGLSTVILSFKVTIWNTKISWKHLWTTCKSFFKCLTSWVLIATMRATKFSLQLILGPMVS